MENENKIQESELKNVTGGSAHTIPIECNHCGELFLPKDAAGSKSGGCGRGNIYKCPKCKEWVNR